MSAASFAQAKQKARQAAGAPASYPVRAPSEWSWRAAETTLIDGLAAPGALIWCYAPSGAGKSFLALNLGWHLARAEKWYDRAVRRGLVVYVAAEGPGSVELRLHALARYHEVALDDALPLRLIGQAVALDDPAALVDTIRDLERDTGQECVLIVLDTISQLLAAAGLAENDAGMGAVLAFCNALRQETGAAVLALHHTPQADAKRSRGHGAAACAADARWLVEKARNAVVTLRVEHVKDGEPGAEFGFAIRTVEVGQGAYRRPVHGGLVVPTDIRPEPDAKLTPPQKLLVAALARHGAGRQAWTFDHELFKQLVERSGAWDPDSSGSQLRQAASNLRRGLQTRGALTDYDSTTKTVTLAVSWRDYGLPSTMVDTAEQLRETELPEAAKGAMRRTALRAAGYRLTDAEIDQLSDDEIDLLLAD